VLRAEQIDEVGLHEISVLIFVDQHMAELVAVMLADLGVLTQELVGADEEVVEIHRIGRNFASFVGGADGRNSLGHTVEVAEAVMHDLLERLAGIRGEGEQLGEHVRLGEPFVARQAGIVGHTLEQIGLVLAVENAEARAEADRFGMAAQDAVADRVESASPDAVGIRTEQFGDPAGHFPRGFVGKSEEKDFPWLDPVLEQPGHTVDEGARLAAARPGNDEGAAPRGGHGGELLLVQLGHIVDAGAGGGRDEAVQSRSPHSNNRLESA